MTVDQAVAGVIDNPIENAERAQAALKQLTEAYSVFLERQTALRKHQQQTKELREAAQARHEARVQEFADSIRHELEKELEDVTKEDGTLSADVIGAEEAYNEVASSVIDRGFFNRTQLKNLKFPTPPANGKA